MRNNTSRTISILLSAVALSLAGGTAFAQSSKATVKVGDISVLSAVASPSPLADGEWQSILQNTLKTSNKKDLFVSVAMQVGLLTSTLVASEDGTPDTSEAAAAVEVRVLVDGVEALPGLVVFGGRTQTLTAEFQGVINECLSVDLSGNVVLDTECVQPEELTAVLQTMNANSFNFIIPDLRSGNHTVEVQARVNLGATAQAGQSIALGLIGKGSMTVEEVRLVKTPNIEL